MVAGKTGRRVFSYPISYFGMMPDSKDIDIMHRLKAACVSAPASTNDALGGCGMETRLWTTFIEPEKYDWWSCPSCR